MGKKISLGTLINQKNFHEVHARIWKMDINLLINKGEKRLKHFLENFKDFGQREKFINTVLVIRCLKK